MHLLALRTGLLQFKYIPSNSRYWYSSLTFLLWYLNTSLSNALVMLDTVVELTALLPHKGSSASSTFLVDIPCKNMFLQGISTRKVEEALEPLWGSRAVSSTTVSNITKALDKEVFKYHNRKVKDEYQYLLFDGIYLNCKSPVLKARRCILVCYGIKKSGKRELIDFFLTKKGESQEAWEHF